MDECIKLARSIVSSCHEPVGGAQLTVPAGLWVALSLSLSACSAAGFGVGLGAAEGREHTDAAGDWSDLSPEESADDGNAAGESVSPDEAGDDDSKVSDGSTSTSTSTSQSEGDEAGGSTATTSNSSSATTEAQTETVGESESDTTTTDSGEDDSSSEGPSVESTEESGQDSTSGASDLDEGSADEDDDSDDDDDDDDDTGDDFELVLDQAPRTGTHGTAGTLYPDDECPLGSVVVGFEGEFNPRINRLRAQCARLEYSDGADQLTLEFDSYSPWRGEADGTPWQRDCPQDQVVTRVAFNAAPGVTQLRVLCAPIFVDRSGAIPVLEWGAITELEAIGHDGGIALDADCGNGRLATGPRVRADENIAGFGLHCRHPRLRSKD